MAQQSDEIQELIAQLALLGSASHQREQQHELTSTPIFTKSVLEHAAPTKKTSFSQYGLLAGDADLLGDITGQDRDLSKLPLDQDPRVYFNISAPSSAFICGSQGSGKSHTLSCLLENCLLRSDAERINKLNSPLAGLVFHYDPFISDLKGTPCEAAHLSSNTNISVRVLCSPSNVQTMKRTYSPLKNVTVEALMINESHLNTKRMLDLMAVSQEERMPLYLHEITRILREMRVVQQIIGGSFKYATFKKEVEKSPMTDAQKAPLTQRLDTLESFMPKFQTAPGVKKKGAGGYDWSIKPGSLVIVDLSCPCVTSEAACTLFNMCLSLFLEQETSVGRVVALDEAHKYMNAGSEASTLTNTLLSSIRLQRHLGTRVFISTQEPSISPRLLDLCSITIVHRFTSPDWLSCLRVHLAALKNDQGVKAIFSQIIRLRVGEALLFAPSAIIGVQSEAREAGDVRVELVKLGTDHMRVKIRNRVTNDGGKSVMAIGS
ncbi:hypothetical protein QTJ16_002171 [Diplocarpon rosae]|uniref:P-loop containing nucleoside triphosphate hydrolase protein n=1 Tax=Diplocarpon rosae TaxID=946125 RepID=A0AAD9T561_9HELO|nr:hypothetical protein QTJ16_002171 [Diplocarpon rosae]